MDQGMNTGDFHPSVLCLDALFHGIEAAVCLAFRGINPIGFLYAVEHRFVTKPTRENMVCDYRLLQQCKAVSEGVGVRKIESLRILFEHLNYRPVDYHSRTCS